MSVIVVDLNGFCLGYEVYHYQGDRHEKFHCNGLEDIAKFVPEYCYTHEVPKVLINGIPEMAHELATMIYRSNAAEYADKNLEIEVI